MIDQATKTALTRELIDRQEELLIADASAQAVAKLHRELGAIAKAHGNEGREALILLGVAELLKD